jgi:Ribosomal protein L17
LLDQTLVPKVFQELALRYNDRQGGYTRINKFGRREGDNAPSAILELVDGPRDTLFEMTARTIGWEIMGHKLKSEQLKSHAMDDLDTGIESINVDGTEKWLRPITQENIQKVLLYRGEEGKKLLGQKAAAYLVCVYFPWLRCSSDDFVCLQNQLLAEPQAHEGLKAYFREREEEVSKEAPKGKKFTERDDRDGSKRATRNTLKQDKQIARRIWESPVGAVPAGSAATAIGLSYGALGKKRPWQIRRTTTRSARPAITKVKPEQAIA